ncbi:hypothetical protein LCGC14_2835210 [marine sediment metagenome]|uniref:Uncharacterized protein n=1 Tax=marine sediment metagenome TaxID=412755 RepID=A0A0F9B3W5_9ZZZZ
MRSRAKSSELEKVLDGMIDKVVADLRRVNEIKDMLMGMPENERKEWAKTLGIIG